MQHIPAAVGGLETDLRAIFGDRLESVVVYGETLAGAAIHTLAIVKTLDVDDLKQCARHAAAWHDAGLSTPLVLAAHEFERSLDAFPFEFGAIIATHLVASGRNPFDGVAVDPEDLRRACEVQARSHLLHLREGFIETRGRSDAIADLVNRSSAAFGALLTSVARLGGKPPAVSSDVSRVAGAARLSSSDAVEIFPAYLRVVEQIVVYVDRWDGSR